jgi:hypothetical protein
VRPNAKARGRCGRCSRRSPRYDTDAGRRRWRALDLGTTKVFLEADSPRVQCRTHGRTVAAVPWARHDAGHTRDFDDLAAWLAVRTSKSAVCQLLRIAWRTVGSIVTRVNADVDPCTRLHPRTTRGRIFKGHDMPCCGGRRRAATPGSTAGPFAEPVARPRTNHLESDVFEYTGPTSLTAVGAYSRRRYRFARTGARLAVDRRDASSLAAVPRLRRLGRGD